MAPDKGTKERSREGGRDREERDSEIHRGGEGEINRQEERYVNFYTIISTAVRSSLLWSDAGMKCAGSVEGPNLDLRP